MLKRPKPRTLVVISKTLVSPNMLSIKLGGEGLKGFPAAQAGGYVKLMLPNTKPLGRPYIRTYTIRRQAKDSLDIEFVLHGEPDIDGPAVEWARKARNGDEIQIGGPGPAKPLPQNRDYYVIAGDMTSLPAIAVNLENLSDEAKGVAFIEVHSEADRQSLTHPAGIEVQWFINPHPGQNPNNLVERVKLMPWPQSSIYAWSATEFSTMKKMRSYLREERGLKKEDLYISSYWKQGLVEDEHKKVKSQDARKYT